MSAGICIMNKNAIALAADSAVTVGNHIAIHNSANKLFALSRFEPVGVIVYANASFMQIPIEIIIKQYKKHLFNSKFSSLRKYVDDFILFLESNLTLFHFSVNESNYVENVYVNLLNGMVGDYKNFMSEKIRAVSRELNESELSIIQQKTYNTTIQFIDGLPPIPGSSLEPYIEKSYSTKIATYLKSSFAWLTEDQNKELTQKICSLYDKDFFRDLYVGMCFAGYGTDEIFPCMYHLHIGGVIDGKLRYIFREETIIAEDNHATITPLAQTDVMQTFLFGINDGFIEKLASDIPKEINKSISSMDNSWFANGQKTNVIKNLYNSTKNIIDEIIKKAHNEFMGPILHSVSTLPIEELALLAESMINITSVRRKVALDGNIGTVGGPIDIAIISKSDGFIWMKRKHYFDAKYNPQYMFTHYPNNILNEVNQNESSTQE